MPHFFAEFSKRDGILFRWDTRIYLSDFERTKSEGKCIGAIVAKNPGSAGGSFTKWGPLCMRSYDMLSKVKEVLDVAFERANKHPPNDAYFQVLNLFYICGTDPVQAKRALKSVNEIDEAETRQFPFVWFAWGGSLDGLDTHKQRFRDLFQKRDSKDLFYLLQRRDAESDEVRRGVPGNDVTARHPIGMRTKKVEDHIAELILSMPELSAS